MGLRKEIKKRLSKANGRLRREGRRLASLVLCGVMVAGNLSAVPVSVLADSDSDHEFTYEIERAALQEALQTAISEGDTVNEDLAFAGEYAEEYEQLLEADGTLYELEPVIADDDDDRDNALSLRVFARIEGDIPIDSMYEIDGTEEIVFLVSNKTEETVTASIYVDGLETEAITILPADAIPVANESSVAGSAAVTSGTLSGGPSGGGSGSGGSAAGTPLEIEETGSAADEVRIEITDTTADDDTTTDPAIEDSNVSVVTDGDTQTDGNEIVDNDPTEGVQTSADGEETDDLTGDTEEAGGNIADDRTMDADQAEADNADANNKKADVTDTNNKDAVAADTDTKDGYEAADDTNDSDAKGEDADAANEDSKSNDGAGSDNTSDTADAENTDTSGETDTTGNSSTDTANNENSGSKEDTAGNNNDSDITEDSDVSILGSAISVHRGILLAAGKATASDADETASDSDASNAIEGITYESVQLDKKGTAAFATTAADLRLDEVVLVEYTAQENDVAVTVTAPAGALLGGARLSVSLYEEDSEEYAAAGESVGYAAEDETTGMAAIDITFYDEDGGEVEPLAPVTVSIDVSEVIPESADTSTIEVQHLTETEEGIEPVLVADVTEDTEGTVDTDTVRAEFEVESFSVFTITWSTGNWNDATTNIQATTYLYDSEETVGGGTKSLTGTSGSLYDLTSSNSDLDIEGYTLVSAKVTDGTDTYDATGITVTIAETGSGSNRKTTYTYTYTNDKVSDEQLYSGSTAQTSIAVSLYYVKEAGISISGTGSDTEGYTLTAITIDGYTYSEKTWTFDDESLVTWTPNEDGSIKVVWSDETVAGDSITVAVSSTYTDYLGETDTVDDTYTLTKGQVGVTITTYVGNSEVSGAQVALVDSDGDIVASGTTGSDGTVTLNVLPGDYTIEATYTSGNNVYGYSSSSSEKLTVTSSGGSKEITLTSQDTYNHVDIRVTGTYTLKLDDGTEITLNTYIYDGNSIEVTLPDGTVLEGTATYSNDNSEIEYRYENISVSAQWDGETYEDKTTYLTGQFTLSGYVLISVDDVKNSGLTETQIESIFGSYEIKVVSSGNSSSVAAGTYYIIPFSDYHPKYNVCEGSTGNSGGGGGFSPSGPGQQGGNSRGYDFEIDMDTLLMALSDKLIVMKYVIDENGEIVSATQDETEFSFSLNKVNDTAVGTATLTSGGSHTFEDIEEGYYKVEEEEKSGYVPVSISTDEYGNVTLAESGYIQYVQSETKTDGTIASVTYYNLKLEHLGTAKIEKRVVDDTAVGDYSDKTFTFKLYTEDNKASSLNDITVSVQESKEFYLNPGTYTIIELASELENGDSQTVTIGDTTLTLTTAGSDDPYGLDEGTVYYYGEITVKAGESLTYVVTNTYASGVNVTLKKVDEEGDVLSGAIFTLNGDEYTTGNDGTVVISNLASGTYTLTETKAPGGYNLLTKDIVITVSSGTVSSVTYEGSESVIYDPNTMTITVTNTAGSALPVTGGPGTTPFRIAGLLLTSCSAYLIYKTLRRKGGWLGE